MECENSISELVCAVYDTFPKKPELSTVPQASRQVPVFLESLLHLSTPTALLAFEKLPPPSTWRNIPKDELMLATVRQSSIDAASPSDFPGWSLPNLAAAAVPQPPCLRKHCEVVLPV